jgi:mono/diheme cytochrome c family protein
MRSMTVLSIVALAGCGSSDDDTGATQTALEARGEYLVEHVAGCGNCHTPYVDGRPDTTRRLAGVTDRHTIANVGKINSANLTPHETGLKTWTDDQIKRAIREGIRNDGSVMWFNMPYYELANLTDDDLNAIVAYLRSVPPVDNALTRRPYELRTTPFLPITGDFVPQTTLPATDAKYATAQRGRYLASFGCLHCHTPNATTGDYRRNPEKVFAGNLKFEVSPYVPTEVFSRNLTPHENGIVDLDAAQVTELIKNSGAVLCKPMATLSTHYLSGMTDDDASAIALYLTTIPPNDTGVIAPCTP